MNTKSHKKQMFLYFIIKGNGGAYEVGTSPNMGGLENEFKHILQLDRGSRDFVTRTE